MIIRTTTESKMTVSITPPPLRENYREFLNTPLLFLNHMIEQIAWRSRLNIEVDVKLDKFHLEHVICEDLGQTVGRAIRELFKNSCGYGIGCGIIDEARAFCALSFESRALFVLDNKVDLKDRVEGMQNEDLIVFLDGIAQGAMCTIQLDLQRGENMHHIWEAAFRALGIALANAYQPGPTSGVAGAVSFEKGVH